MKNLTASDRSALIRLASSLPKGSEERRAILASLVRTLGRGWRGPTHSVPGIGEIEQGLEQVALVIAAVDEWRTWHGFATGGREVADLEKSLLALRQWFSKARGQV